MSSILSVHRIGFLVAVSVLVLGCETSKPEGGPARTSASKIGGAVVAAASKSETAPTDKAAANSAAPAGGGDCAPVVEHVTKLLFERIKELPEEQRQMTEQQLPRIKQQIQQACTERWTDEFKQCALKAKTEADVSTCAQNLAPRPPQPRPGRQPPPGQPQP